MLLVFLRVCGLNLKTVGWMFIMFPLYFWAWVFCIILFLKIKVLMKMIYGDKGTWTSLTIVGLY